MRLNAGEALGRALTGVFVRRGAFVAIRQIASRPWASATFSGETHTVGLRLSGSQAGAAADAVLSDLRELEIPIVGHVLIDIVCDAEMRTGGEVLLCLGALTVEAD